MHGLFNLLLIRQAFDKLDQTQRAARKPAPMAYMSPPAQLYHCAGLSRHAGFLRNHDAAVRWAMPRLQVVKWQQAGMTRGREMHFWCRSAAEVCDQRMSGGMISGSPGMRAACACLNHIYRHELLDAYLLKITSIKNPCQLAIIMCMMFESCIVDALAPAVICLQAL
jgi:hypothetical protein